MTTNSEQAVIAEVSSETRAAVIESAVMRIMETVERSMIKVVENATQNMMASMDLAATAGNHAASAAAAKAISDVDENQHIVVTDRATGESVKLKMPKFVDGKRVTGYTVMVN